MKFREEVLNVELAEILRGYGLPANPEIIESKKKLPDVKILIGGLKVVLEGKEASHRRQLEDQAQDRLKLGIADISLAILYPIALFDATDLDRLKTNMSHSPYSGVIYHWGKNGIDSIPFENRNVKEVAELISRVFTLYVKNDLLKQKIDEIEAVIKRLAEEASQRSLFYFTDAVEERLRDALGIAEDIGQKT